MNERGQYGISVQEAYRQRRYEPYEPYEPTPERQHALALIRASPANIVGVIQDSNGAWDTLPFHDWNEADRWFKGVNERDRTTFIYAAVFDQGAVLPGVIPAPSHEIRTALATSKSKPAHYILVGPMLAGAFAGAYFAPEKRHLTGGVLGGVLGMLLGAGLSWLDSRSSWSS